MRAEGVWAWLKVVGVRELAMWGLVVGVSVVKVYSGEDGVGVRGHFS